MPTTPHLALPLLAAAQAQKHVTHNEALVSLDAIVHLSVKERHRLAPPAAPADGDRYLVGADATGEFAGHTHQVAWFDLATWRFITPKAGWQAYVESERASFTYDGEAWTSPLDTPQVSRLGIGTAADAQNPLAAKLNSALFTARELAEGGTGDLRVVLNKENTSGVVSQIYQRAYSGRAETGLIGQDDFGIRVSPDGSQWRDAIRIDSRSGSVSFPGGLGSGVGLNLLINSHFLINQRGYSSGMLSLNSYGYDRWKAGTGGCLVTRLSDGTISMSGTLDQIIDMGQAPALLGANNFGGSTMTFSIENVTGVLSVVIGGIAVSLPEKPGRQSVTVTLDPATTGHLTCRLQSTGTATFTRPKLELGSAATPWQGDWLETEEGRCRRYYHRVLGSSASLLAMPVMVHRRGSNFLEFPYVFPVTMRANPTIMGSSFIWVTTQPVGNQLGYYDTTNLAWLGPAGGGIVLISFGKTSPNGVILRVTSTTSFDGPAGGMGQLNFGASAYIAIQAEL